MNLVDRAIKMITTPKTEWDAVAAETAAPSQVTVGYVVPLSLLAHLASFIGSAFVGAMVSAAFGIHRGVTFWLVSAILGWVLTILVVYIEGWVVNALAPTFASKPDYGNAFKLVAFASTPAWVGGLLAIIPFLGWIGALAGGLYSIYVFYLGVPKLMATPADKVVPYMLVCALVMIVLWFVVGACVAGVTAAIFGASMMGLGR